MPFVTNAQSRDWAPSEARPDQTVQVSDLCFSTFIPPLGAYSADLELISLPMPLPHSPLS